MPCMKKTSDEKSGTPRNAMGLKRPLMKKESPLETQGAQKDIRRKKRHPRNARGSKRHPMKKEAPLEMQGAQKDLL
jgi:hypothetical protein